MPYFTPLLSPTSYTTHLLPTRGKVLLVAYWADDATSLALISALKKCLPKKDFAAHNVSAAFCFDVYAVPELATQLDVSFVPSLMWFADGAMDAVVWNAGVAPVGEGVEEGVERVVGRIKGGSGVGFDSDEDW